MARAPARRLRRASAARVIVVGADVDECVAALLRELLREIDVYLAFWDAVRA
jgi:hypothetical protein